MSHSAAEKLRPGSVAFAEAFPGLATTGLIAPEPVRSNDIPGLRALVKAQFPHVGPQKQAKILEAAKPHLGSFFTGGLPADIAATFGLQGGYASNAKTTREYSNSIAMLARNEKLRDHLNYFKEKAYRASEPEGAEGFGSFPSNEGKVGGRVPMVEGFGDKQTLAAKYIQPGTDVLDTTIHKKVESEVNADFFNYLAANPERGIYNAMYLQDMQYQKEVRFGGDLALPRSGDDQLYFQSIKLNPQYDNQQAVEMELMDKFETELYAIYASKDQNWDPLHDRRMTHDPIMDRTYNSHFVCANSLMADGKWPYPDPDEAHSSGFVNRLGFKPVNDAWLQPSEPSKWLPTQKQLSTAEQLRKNQELGFSSWQLPASYNSFPYTVQ